MNVYSMQKRGGKTGEAKTPLTVDTRAEDAPRRMETEHPDLLSYKGTQGLIHELRVHQREQERQNEELRIDLVAMNALRARYANFYEMAPVGYVVLSEEGMILEANLRASTMLEVPRCTLDNQPLTQFFVDEDREVYHLFLKTLFDTGEPQTFEMRMKDRDGALLWALLSASVLENQRNGARICLVTIGDITEIRNLQADLGRMDLLAAMDVLAADLARDIRNPLALVLHNLECLREDLPNLTNVVVRFRLALRELVSAEVLAEVAGESAKLLNPIALEGLVKRAKRAIKGILHIKEIVKEFTASSHVEQESLSTVDLNHPIKKLRRVDQ
jgi:PAS domain S-box-containing protein